MLNEISSPGFEPQVLRRMIAALCILSLVPGDSLLLTQSKQENPPASQSSNPPTNQPSGEAPAQETAKLPPQELDSLVAPIALYPDPLLSQTLVASTYPLEVVQLKQWLDKNSGLKDKELVEAAKKQNWDPSIQALASLPDVVKRLSENIKWTSDLGNAFLAQQSDVMDAVQRMRKKAKDTGNLKSSDQQKVETKVVENKQVIIVEQAKPEVIYVPTYNPTVVYGPPVYPYPPVYYPPPGYYAAGMAISFGVGVAMGAAWGGGWGWNCGWGGHNNVYINNNNNFVRSYNSQNISNRNVSNRTTRTGNTWQHNPQHRGGAPYSDRATARQYGGTARGESLANRQQTARQNQSLQTARQNGGTGRPEQAAMRERSGSTARQSGTASTRSAGDPSNRGTGDRVGNRSVSSGSGSGSSSAFGSGGFSGASARSSSSRGASSMGASRGSRGGGGGRRR